MDSNKLNDWMQVIGIFALVASLIFVGFQIKQTHEIAISSAYQERTATAIEMITANAANENGLAAWYRPQTAADLDSLSPEEAWAGRQMSLGLLLAYDNNHFQFESGFISGDAWATIRVDMKSAMTMPFFRRYALGRAEAGRLRPSFREVIMKVDRELAAEASR
jgi:hypothetical protein